MSERSLRYYRNHKKSEDARSNLWKKNNPDKVRSYRLKNQARIKEARIKLKRDCVDYKGGKCAICGYNKTNKALTFHHVDPETKFLDISTMVARGHTWETIKAELDKCVLLCYNCHMEITWKE